MIAAALLLCACQGALPPDAARPEAVQPDVVRPDVVREVRAEPEVRLELAARPASVEVGEPFELELLVSHPRELLITGLDEDALALDESWVVLGSQRPAPEPDPADPRRARSRRLWSVASLEPGARSLPPLSLAAAGRGPWTSPEASVEVRGVLAADEDAPRPLRGLPEDFSHARPAASARAAWILGAGALGLCLLAGAAVLVLRRRRARAAPAPSARERLEALAAEAAAERSNRPAALRAASFALAELVRSTVDARRGRVRSGLTDEEWLSELERGGELPDERASLAFVLERCAAVKYAALVPTEWAFRETLERARQVVVPAATAGERAA